MGLWNDFVFMPQRRRQCAPSGQDIARHRLIMADRNNVPLVRQDHEADPFDMSVWEAFLEFVSNLLLEFGLCSELLHLGPLVENDRSLIA